MEYVIPFLPVKSSLEIKHGDRIALIGSCFSDSMTEHFELAGFETLSNPFGTLFHPLALAKVLESSIRNNEHVDLHQRNDLFFSWDASSKLYGTSENELKNRVIEARKATRAYLARARVLIVTFGTSWGYTHNKLDYIVANCHKENQNAFTKELSSTESMISQWNTVLKLLKEFNPELKVIFTVSPVRHSKDGLIENNRSKARLIELAHSLTESNESFYFPSYELVIDQLRDYRFYKIDLVHPSEEAISHVWNFFCETYFSEETNLLRQKVNQINRSLNHTPLHPESRESEKHIESTLGAKQNLSVVHPEVYWK